MNFALVYLIRRFLYVLGNFFHHWYVDGSRAILHWLRKIRSSIYERLPRSFVLRYLGSGVVFLAVIIVLLIWWAIPIGLITILIFNFTPPVAPLFS